MPDEIVLTKQDLDRELDAWDDRHPGLEPHERFVAWFVRAYRTDKEAAAVESLTGANREKGIDALLIDDSNDLITVVQGKYRDRIMSRSEKPESVLEFAQLPQELSADDREFQRFTTDLDQLALREAKKARKRLREKKYRLNLSYVTLGRCGRALANRARAAARRAGKELDHPPELQIFDGNDVLGVLADYLDGVAPPVPSLELQSAGDIAYQHDPTSGVQSWVFSMNGAGVGKLIDTVGEKLFARNIRGYLGDNRKVNQAIRNTLNYQPASFLFLNNGITVICDGANLGHSGGAKFLEVFNPQIINGQQTTYALHSVGDKARKAKVFVRVIRVTKGKSEGWADYENMVASIVKATNSQNMIKASDLRSNDRIQVRLQRDLRELNYFYIRKAGRSQEWDLAVQGHQKVKKEDVARAVMACEDSTTLLNEGGQALFEDDHYLFVFRRKPTELLSRWWLMKAVDSSASGSGERQAAKFLVAQFVWSQLGSAISDNEESFLAGCRARTRDLRSSALNRVIDHAMKGAVQHYRKDRGAGDDRQEINPFFKRRDRFDEFLSFWRSKRSSHRKNFRAATANFKKALRSP